MDQARLLSARSSFIALLAAAVAVTLACVLAPAQQALADMGLSADLVIDDGVSAGGVPSTVVKVLPDGTLQTLRP